ncbi:MAG: hypothetical protein ACRD8O_11890 [Bryobacteraceae bacterium]
MNRAARAAFWLAPPLLCLALYWPALSVWFQQDDFAWLGLSGQVGTFDDLIRVLFTPMAQGTIRPLSERAYFIGLYELFGLDPLPFRIIAFLTQFANLVLVSAITLRLTQSRVAAFLAPVLWTANVAIFRPMTWSSSYNQILCALFILSAFLFFLRYIETGRTRDRVLMWTAFFLGFGALELNVVFPALAATYAFLFARRHFAGTLWLFVPAILFTVMHRLAAPKTSASVYTMYFDTSIVATLWKYWVWGFGATRLKEVTQPPHWLAGVVIGVLCVGLVVFTVNELRQRHWLPLFALAWFVIALGPVLPLRDHLSDYYLVTPTIGLSILGAAAIAAAWRAALPVKIAAVIGAAAYAGTSVPVVVQGEQWAVESTSRIEKLLGGVAQARRLHPDRTILLTGIDDELFWTGMIDNPFRLIGVSDVYLAPDNGALITPHPELGRVSDFVLPAGPTLIGLERGDIVVYTLMRDRLRNITLIYESTARLQLKPEEPRRVDVGSPLLAYLLGKSWHAREGGSRWMPRSATLRIGGPRSTSERLYILGYSSAQQLAHGSVELRVKLDGKALPAANIQPGTESFNFDFAIPPELVGRPVIEIEVSVDRTFSDGRELGAAFGVFEIR